MLVKKLLLIWVIWIILTGLSFSQLVYEVNFSQEELGFHRKDNFDYIELADCKNSEEEGKPQLPFRTVNILLPADKEIDSIICEVETQILPGSFLIYPSQKKEKTNGELVKDIIELDSSIYFSENYYPENQYEIINQGHMSGNSILSLAIYPLKYMLTSHKLVFYNSFKLKISLQTKSVLYYKPSSLEYSGFYQSYLSDFLYNPDELHLNISKCKTQILDQPKYLIITSGELKSLFYPLLEWKTQKGLRVSMVTLDSIENSCYGIDTQDKIRNFLIQAYSEGVLWVVLGGDGDIIPYRYTYHANTSTSIPITNLQICDLYYADLDGIWDKDGDGIYGESVDDFPDILPELFIGRAPVNTKEEAEIFVRKIIDYEKNPGSGDYSFIKKAVWMCSDQLRDWETVGQHTLVSQQIDQSFFQNLESLVEAPSGSAENPIGPTGSGCIETLNQGWGIIGVLAHGKSNGFVASSHLLNQWPKTYVLSDSGIEDGNGHINNLNNGNRLGIIYSISCNQTALDVETEPVLGTPPCIGKSFLIARDRGAVAFLGYSRWGWVSTSYKLASEFMKNLFKPEYGHHIGVAEAFSKTAYPVYRDLNYGHNLLGDPEMQIWTATPSSLEVNSPAEKIISDSVMYIEIKSNQIPLQDAKVTLSYKDSLFYFGLTGTDGKIAIPLSDIRPGEFSLTVTKHNFLPYEERFKLKSSSDVKDNEVQPPLNFELGQNYPNPFNPSTSIPFSIKMPGSMSDKSVHTTVKIYNILGQLVRTLLNEQRSPGNYRIVWDGTNEYGNEVSSGIYFYQLKAGDYRKTKKMTLVR